MVVSEEGLHLGDDGDANVPALHCEVSMVEVRVSFVVHFPCAIFAHFVWSVDRFRAVIPGVFSFFVIDLVDALRVGNGEIITANDPIYWACLNRFRPNVSFPYPKEDFFYELYLDQRHSCTRGWGNSERWLRSVRSI